MKRTLLLSLSSVALTIAFALPAYAVTVEKAPQPVSKAIAAAPAAVTDKFVVAAKAKKTEKAKVGAKAKADKKAKKAVKTKKVKAATKAKADKAGKAKKPTAVIEKKPA